MNLNCEIIINGEDITVSKEIIAPDVGPVLEIIKYRFSHRGIYVGGFTVTEHNKEYSLLGKRISWDLVNEKKQKYNRYFLEKMARLAEEKFKKMEDK